MSKREGIAIAGNMLVDFVKTLPMYPKPGMLATIESVEQAVGGCVPNTLLDLAAIGGGYPLQAIGRVGDDDAGRYVLRCLETGGVDTGGVHVSHTGKTSFSDAMCSRETGERTFFHYRGANAAFCPDDAPPEALTCRLLHIGYVLLLDQFDAPDAEYGTVMARYLHAVQQQGILTCIDAVSDSAGRFSQTVSPALRYCDYAIMNEIEACAVCGLEPRTEDGRLIMENLVRALETFVQLGVKRRAVLHCPEAGVCLDTQTGEVTVVPSLDLPKGYIRGSVGAGDAFCAGCLHAIYQGWDAQRMLQFASAAAAANLSAADSVSGMKDEHTLTEMMTWRRKEL